MSDDQHSTQPLSEAAEKFMLLLERRMIEGHSDVTNQHWATVELGVPLESFERLKALILRSWKLEARTYEAICGERDKVRVGYWEIYRRALEKEKLGEALRALDAIARLDGLDQPSQIAVTIGQGAITNQARETIASLLGRMRELSSGKATRSLKGFREANGHTTNGHSVIEVEEKS